MLNFSVFGDVLAAFLLLTSTMFLLWAENILVIISFFKNFVKVPSVAQEVLYLHEWSMLGKDTYPAVKWFVNVSQVLLIDGVSVLLFSLSVLLFSLTSYLEVLSMVRKECPSPQRKLWVLFCVSFQLYQFVFHVLWTCDVWLIYNALLLGSFLIGYHPVSYSHV